MIVWIRVNSWDHEHRRQFVEDRHKRRRLFSSRETRGTHEMVFAYFACFVGNSHLSCLLCSLIEH
ncbi:MAG TPA: hypothetical protein DCP63_15875 [Bacteroidetes bacterium]|nr:hypothetical protein [Bacteroidota bacterium]